MSTAPATSAARHQTLDLGRFLALLLAVLVGATSLAACSTVPDKRILQYLNQEGFGQRYVGNVRDEAYVTVGDTISVFDAYDAGFDVTGVVELDGTITLPQLGTVPIAGMTRSEVESYLTQRRAEIVTRSSIKVRTLVLRPRQYWVLGEVGSQGRHYIDSDLTIFDAVISAAPLALRANLGRVKLIRADAVDPLVMFFDVRAMLDHGDASRNYQIQENDIIIVPGTFMVRLGNFMGALVTPIGQVLNGIIGPLLTFARLDRISDGSSLFLF